MLASQHLTIYIGVNTAQSLAKAFAGRFRVLMIEKNSHFQHLFAFPRFAVTALVDTHKAFIPLNPGTFKDCPPASGSIVRAIVTSINGSQVQLDRRVNVGGQEYDALPFAYLVSLTFLYNCYAEYLRSLPQAPS